MVHSCCVEVLNHDGRVVLAYRRGELVDSVTSDVVDSLLNALLATQGLRPAPSALLSSGIAAMLLAQPPVKTLKLFGRKRQRGAV